MISHRIIFFEILVLVVISTTGDNKLCRVRDNPGLISREIWEFWTGFLCYTYTNPNHFIFRYNVTGGTFNNQRIPLAMINDTVAVPFDYQNVTSLDYISQSFTTDHFFQMWIDCCEEAVTCCDNFMTNENVQPDETYPCPAIWDGWSCWPPAEANTVEKQKCSTQATDSDVCELMSEKTCFTNGTWNQKTNYEVCSPCCQAPSFLKSA